MADAMPPMDEDSVEPDALSDAPEASQESPPSLLDDFSDGPIVGAVLAAPKLILSRLTLPENTFVTGVLRQETTGGLLMLAAAAVALLWANLAEESYFAFIGQVVGPAVLHLDLTLAVWAADGLLAVFFLVAGLELKRELVHGELRNPAQAILPAVAAVCGMVVPIAVYLLVNALGDGTFDGWAVPTATDIAFALAVLAVAGSAMPNPLRAFLLTLAVVDDLLAIVIIAIFFTDEVVLWALFSAAALLAIYAYLQQRRFHGLWLYVPLCLLAWGLMHYSGVHATVAGIAIGLLTRVKSAPDEDESPAHTLEHRLQPWSAGFCVPIFALTNAGVVISAGTMGELFTNPLPLGIMAGLVIGKTVGVFGGTWLAARFTKGSLDPSLEWRDVFAVSVLAGVGFTVSLLIGELAFAADHPDLDLVKVAVLVGSLMSATLAVALLRPRNAYYRELAENEGRDEDADGIPDVHQR